MFARGQSNEEAISPIGYSVGRLVFPLVFLASTFAGFGATVRTRTGVHVHSAQTSTFEMLNDGLGKEL